MELLPREKMIQNGVDALSDDELLAIMLGVGSGTENVFEMSKRLTKEYSLSKLFHMSIPELTQIPGIKNAKACKLMAVFEIVKRILKEEANKKELITSKDVFDYVYPDYMQYKKEVITVIYVDSGCRILNEERFTEEEYGTVHFPIKTILKHLMDYDANGIFLVHNHPNGVCYPSIADDKVTEDISMLTHLLGLHLYDHIIIAKDEYYSYGDKRHK